MTGEKQKLLTERESQKSLHATLTFRRALDTERRGRRTRGRVDEEITTVMECTHCGRSFPSRTKLFKHLRGEDHDENDGDGGAPCMRKALDAGMVIAQRTERVAVLIVYAGEQYIGAGSAYQGPSWNSEGVHGEIERLLWTAAHAADGGCDSLGKIVRLTRASRTDRGLHSLGNVVSLVVNKIVDPLAGRVWVQHVNERLPNDVRVLGRWPVESDFHAKKAAMKRRYEIMVPLHTLVAESPVAAVEVAQRSAQAEWRWEQSICTTESSRWSLALPPTSGDVVTFGCTATGLAVFVPPAATGVLHYELPRPAPLSDYVYTEWWQQLIQGRGLGPFVQLVVGVGRPAIGQSCFEWFVSEERYETTSALDILDQRELFICQPCAARMRWLALDHSTWCVMSEAKAQRLPTDSMISCIGWFVRGRENEATACRMSGLRVAECLLHGPFAWHDDAPTTDKLHNFATAGVSLGKSATGEKSLSPEHKRMRPADDDVAATQSEDRVRHWGLYRIRLLARLKDLIKKFQGNRLHSYHNFSEGVSSTESRAKKRAKSFRFYCRGIVQLGPSLECVMLTFQTLGDGFLYSQIRKITGLLVTSARGDVPDSYIQLALNENVLLPVPCAPAHLGAIADCTYSRKLVRSNIDEPGEIKQSTCEKGSGVNFSSYRRHETAAWRAKLHAHMAALERSTTECPSVAMAKSTPRSDAVDVHGVGKWDQWVQNVLYDESSATCVTRMMRELTFYQEKQRAASDLVCGAISTEVPGAFRHILCLLREAEQSGRWPASSVSRRNVIDRNSRRGESFALGRMPAHLKQPTANELFPELLQAAIALEHIVMPHRPPSSTVVVNKHAQFKPHKDSGAGAGQHVSMIVGLGEYTGGELVVEGSVNDIRYKPLEFDGWNQRHWTLPFDGERYSIVWFTPLGCENMAPTACDVDEAMSGCKLAFAARSGEMVPRVDQSSKLSPSLEQPEWAVELHPQMQSIAAGAAGTKNTSNGSQSRRQKPVLMPLIGLGTYRLRGSDIRKVVSTALSAGCRLIDTAASYCNEAEIGAVLRDEGSLKGDDAVLRENVFITSKLRPQDAGFDRTLKAFDASLDRLGVTYLDMYLIHWPGTAKTPPTSATHKENRLASWVTALVFFPFTGASFVASF